MRGRIRQVALMPVSGSRGAARSGWQRNHQRRALAYHGFAAYGAPVVLNDSVDDGKTQSSALTHLFCGIERFKDFLKLILLKKTPLQALWTTWAWAFSSYMKLTQP